RRGAAKRDALGVAGFGRGDGALDGAAAEAFGAVLGLADAGGGDRVGLEVVGQALALAALVGARDRVHAFEHAGHRRRVVAAAGEGADADAVGLGFVRAGVVDLALRGQALGGGDRGHRGVVGGVAAGRLRD